MRDYHGTPYASIDDPRTRHALSIVDYFLRDLSRGMGRIQRGEIPDGSGTPIATPFDATDYFFLPGRGGGQVAHGGSAASESLTLSSTGDATKGFIYLGDSSAFDEANVRLGIGLTGPTATLTLGQAAVPPNQANADDSPLQWQAIGSSNFWECVQSKDDASTYISRSEIAGTYNTRMVLQNAISASETTWTVSYRARRTGTITAGTTIHFAIARSDGQEFTGPTIDATALTTSWVDYTTVVSSVGSTGITANSIRASYQTGGGLGNRVDITYIAIEDSSGGVANLTEWYTAGAATLTSIVDASARLGLGTGSDTLTQMLTVKGSVQLNGATSGNITLTPAATTTTHTLTLPSAQGAASTLLQNNGSGALSWVAQSSLSILESQIVDGSILARVAGNEIITGNWTFKAAGATYGIESVELNDTGDYLPIMYAKAGGAHGLGDYAFAFVLSPGLTAGLILRTTGALSGSFPGLLFPSAGGEVLTSAAASTSTITNKTFKTTTTFFEESFGSDTFRFSFSGSTNRVVTVQDVTGTMYVSGGTDVAVADGGTGASTATTGFNNLSPVTTRGDMIVRDATNNVRLALGSRFQVVMSNGTDKVNSFLSVANVDLTGQTASIGTTTTLSSPPAGIYAVKVVAMCTTASGSGAPTLDVTIGWTDDVGATTQAVISGLSLSATGRSSGQTVLRVSSGSITHATTINAASGSPQYALYIRIVPLG